MLMHEAGDTGFEGLSIRSDSEDEETSSRRKRQRH
jgi:hypothetical protein